MKLSEAMRKGFELTQERGDDTSLTIYINDTGRITACPIAAAYVALYPGEYETKAQRDQILNIMRERYGNDIVHDVIAFADYVIYGYGVDNVYTRWTRDEIATWLEAKGY